MGRVEIEETMRKQDKILHLLCVGPRSAPSMAKEVNALPCFIVGKLRQAASAGIVEKVGTKWRRTDQPLVLEEASTRRGHAGRWVDVFRENVHLGRIVADVMEGVRIMGGKSGGEWKPETAAAVILICRDAGLLPPLLGIYKGRLSDFEPHMVDVAGGLSAHRSLDLRGSADAGMFA